MTANGSVILAIKKEISDGSTIKSAQLMAPSPIRLELLLLATLGACSPR